MDSNPPTPTPGDSFESFPLTRPEYISAMVHFYRGEMYRSQIWRSRLDTTTNWAVVTAAGIVSFAFSSPEHSAFTIILGTILITNFLAVEARRYRYFSVYRARVRMIEENFYLPLIRRNLMSPLGDWADRVARDLDCPTFKTTYLEAFLFRLRRNYIALYWILFVVWLVKLYMHPVPADSLHEVYARMGAGRISPAVALSLVLLLYALFTLPLFTQTAKRAAMDEIHGLERDMDRWTF
ncbi:MAG TPA: DUF2270 domain-containing protein [Candidatus Polarisedimenticolia bacterium]|nr:DUF2270 domain-containing protein [Candidatus Polarisedimenticolia bacterium]